MNKTKTSILVAAAAFVGFGAGALFNSNVEAAAALNASENAGALAAKLGIAAYEADGAAGGAGAPQKVLIDNDIVRVNLVSFPAGFNRIGKVKRRYNQVAVYIDQSDFTITWNGSTGEDVPADKQRATKTPQGNVSFHAKDSLVSDTHVNSAYRAIFVEMKR
jgi:hypothetical protein